jgi:hypothetical protein
LVTISSIISTCHVCEYRLTSQKFSFFLLFLYFINCHRYTKCEKKFYSLSLPYLWKVPFLKFWAPLHANFSFLADFSIFCLYTFKCLQKNCFWSSHHLLKIINANTEYKIMSSKSVLSPYLSISDCSNTVLFFRQVENLRNDL